jgi:hypothetical protein
MWLWLVSSSDSWTAAFVRPPAGMLGFIPEESIFQQMRGVVEI